MNRAARPPIPPAQTDVDSLQRGLEILRAFRGAEKSMRFADIIARTGLPRLTAQKLVNTLVAQRFLRFLPDLDRYEPDVSCLVLGHAVRRGLPVLRVAGPILSALAADLNVDVVLGKREDLEMLVIEHCGSGPEAVAFAPGTLVPIAQSALGRAWLGAQRPTIQGEFIERIRMMADERDLRSLPAVYRSFQELADHGHHISLNDWWGDWQTVAIPLELPGGRDVLSLAATARRSVALESHLREKVAPALVNAADRINAEVGKAADES